MENPFNQGENRILKPPSTAMVIFGGTGDLTHRKLLPALYNLAQDDYLPASFFVLGTGRSKLTDAEYRNALFDSLKKYSRREVDGQVWSKFSECIYFQSLDIPSEKDFSVLRERLERIAKERGESFNYLYYLATSPNFFGPVAVNLGKAGLVEKYPAGVRTTNLVVEKPFGVDLESARKLNSTLRASFDEHQIFRIDHYLGKETVQNILVFRFANGIFEPLWNRNFIDHIQVSVCESVGVGSRAGYFDQSGIMRDIVQNHLLQMLSLLLIEPPISLSDADSIRDEKVKVMRALKRFSAEDVRQSTVRAQYSAGFIEGAAVPGYMQEKDVKPDSQTETFVALKLEVDNWRWAGVPIYVRAAKRVPRRITEITVFFKRPPGSLFKGRQVSELQPNILAIQVQPNEGISLSVNSKPPGPRLRINPVAMDFSYGSSFGVASADAYERLILDAMKSEATLFTRDDEIEEAWDLLEPVMGCWAGDNPPELYTHEAGTWGPKAAADLLRSAGHRWRRF